MDFTVKKYELLLNAIRDVGYSFQTYEEYLRVPKDKVVILRHDVDSKPNNSLVFAEIQYKLGIKGVYYFRAVAASWDESIILKINKMGHEIGYHYENLSVTNGNMDLAIEDFTLNLSKLRNLVPVNTICMHGSPLSKFDNKNLWKKYNYHSFGIVGEPYFDTNYKSVYYLTDTGRTWNNKDISVRDKVISSFELKFSNTDQIITSFQENRMPSVIMFTFHPQRWSNQPIEWIIEFVSQNIKNVIKKILVRFRNK
jgi:hypothetical protein